MDWANPTIDMLFGVAYPRFGDKWGLWKEDIYYLFDLLQKEKPKVIVEIGAGYGVSSRLFAGCVKGWGGKLYSIEPNPRQEWYDRLNSYGLLDVVELIQKASPWVDWEGKPEIDFLFIDGWHNFRNVMTDYFYWEKFVKIGGIIAFHDTILYTAVQRAVKEILKTEHLECIGKVEDSLPGTEIYRKIRDPRGKTAFFGPWTGEIGWEVAWWQGFCRKEAHNWNYSIVCTYPGHDGLYQDFANEITYHELEGGPMCGHLNRVRGEFDFPNVTKVFVPPISDLFTNNQQEFIKFGHDAPNTTYDILLHLNEGSISPGYYKFFPYWGEVISKLLGLGYTIACFGRNIEICYPQNLDGWKEGTTDLRNIPLAELMKYMAGCKVVVGTSSGIMHLASYCAANIVVLCDNGTWTFGHTTRSRFETILNPFNSPVIVLDQHNYQPPAELVINSVCALIEQKKATL